ncbi:hypothetical protein [Alteromonas sp. RKMC-009]|uniref:hypothetical protein n=1 Tax=Alteromonas sp. RKMC-009 TaxID=2267264 RepID=UPI000E69CE68|nr:hypothetical protein [Alteromonas sp. RKMC-009]AYA64318.1 hypothetical protein DS731_10085 [Alteromonas sp. RKMC-009]
MRITAHKNTSKFFSYRVQKDGVDLDLDAMGVTNIQVADEGQSISALSGDITFSANIMSIRWGSLKLPAGEYSPTVYLYNPENPKGLVLYGPETNPVTLVLVEDERPHLVNISATTDLLTLSGPAKPISVISVDGALIKFSKYSGSFTNITPLEINTPNNEGSDLIYAKTPLPSAKSWTFSVLMPDGVKSEFKKRWIV